MRTGPGDLVEKLYDRAGRQEKKIVTLKRTR